MAVEAEKMQFLGTFGIFREAMKTIYTGRKIFTHITLALILPLSFLSFGYLEISKLFSGTTTTPKFQQNSEIIYFILFIFAFLILLTILSLLAAAAVIYTVACIHTARDVTFKQVMSVVPKLFKRLLITQLCISAASFGLLIVGFIILSLIFGVVFVKYGLYGFGKGSIIILSLFMIIYFVIAFYISIIWQLSKVVSVLENSCGFEAMAKSKALVKGKMKTAIGILIWLSFPSAAIQLVLNYVVLQSVSLGVVILGVSCFFSYPLFFLFTFVTETELYFVCKSYHQENIDKSVLSDNLEVYINGEYAPLKAKDVEDEKFQIV